MKFSHPIAVASRSFSRHPVLREELEEHFENIHFNDEGTALKDKELIAYLSGKRGAIIALEKVDKSVLEQLPDLRVISKFGVGLDNLDTEYIKNDGRHLGWSGGVNRRSVTELVLAFLFGGSRNVIHGSRTLADGVWKTQGGRQVSEKTIGIIGCGYIGSDLAKCLAPFGMKILINDIEDKTDFCRSVGGEIADKERIYRESDLISLHTPLTTDTRNLFNHETFSKLKEDAFLVNTARGGIINETDLFAWLEKNPASMAAMDVFENEPADKSPLFTLPNFIGTPHIGGSSQEAILNMGRSAIENLVQGFKSL